ncbi:methylated-DNA--[protein]-cysteine S-methyltransferase [Sphingomonas colocasiae]|uniref:Methylated-DNA--[protein]-cysteine S-methyltransferase n=1 Tax=Sphingomonas colocasiae TaxID=1848973 RepID=A0ABS7PSB6_9SPHN|nr:methylated-DNA--[protein]-cysteine S-methyltransferase [Sphingomonas colocasiae]MBY8824230.1 methylated-DNA--[protein]-cysteine S-methyltransferase [Sphingomonas colocasiae]
MSTDDRPFAGQTLSYGFIETPLGVALVAASERGVAAILIGSDRARLLRDLHAALEGATLRGDATAMTETLDAVATLLAYPEKGASFALDLRGSPLELAVWKALRMVPGGQTIGYGELARWLNIAATAQEVGAACAANRIAVAVPCHRVVKADGGISGYRWGVERKRRLINMEAVA